MTHGKDSARRLRRHELLDMLHRCAHAAIEYSDPMEQLRSILASVIDCLGMEAGAIYLRDESTQSLRLSVRQGINEQHVQEIERRRQARPEWDTPTQVASSQDVIFIRNMAEDPRFEGMWDQLEKRSYAHVPLLARDQLVGVMGIVTKAGSPLREEEADVLKALGHQVGLLIENSQLLSHAQHCEQRMQQLYQVATRISASLQMKNVLEEIARGACDLLASPYGFVAFPDSEGTHLVLETVVGPQPHGIQGLTLELYLDLRHGAVQAWRPILRDGHDHHPTHMELQPLIAAGFESILAVPILRADQSLGMVGVLDPQPRAFSSMDTQLLLQLSRQVAVAVENAQLYQQVRSLATMEERNRLAREIHDDLAQEIGLINLKIAATDALLCQGKFDQAQEQVADLKSFADQAYVDVREALFNLRVVPRERATFLHTLEDYLHDYQRHYGLQVCLHYDVTYDLRLSPEVEMQVIRIVMEALSNARKHSRANGAMIHVASNTQQIDISIIDNGQGFNPVQVNQESGGRLGLQIMQERARAIGAEVQVRSQPGRGTKVSILIPKRRSR